MAPYEHQEFPKRVYHESFHEIDQETGKESERSTLVNSQAELDALHEQEPDEWFSTPADCPKPKKVAQSQAPADGEPNADEAPKGKRKK